MRKGENVECPKCDGEGTVKCPKCDGEGKIGLSGWSPVPFMDVLYDALTDNYEECSHCDGTGEVECNKCDGNGTIWEDEDNSDDDDE